MNGFWKGYLFHVGFFLLWFKRAPGGTDFLGNASDSEISIFGLSLDGCMDFGSKDELNGLEKWEVGILRRQWVVSWEAPGEPLRWSFPCFW